jgi:hypothetical protein
VINLAAIRSWRRERLCRVLPKVAKAKAFSFVVFIRFRFVSLVPENPKRSFWVPKVQHRPLTSGPSASTDVYNAEIESISEGKVHLCKLESRKPPTVAVNWRTTYRLAEAQLVGLILLPDFGHPIEKHMRLHWARVQHPKPAPTNNFKPTDPRTAQKLRLEFLGEPPHLDIGAAVAVVDCQSFTPESIPVLNALDHLRTSQNLPFDNGCMLGLGPQTEPEPLSREGTQRQRFERTIEESDVAPIVQLRSDPENRRALLELIEQCCREAQFDAGQFDSFLEAIRYSVHCTQGPPGTGKVNFMLLGTFLSLLYSAIPLT